MRLEMDTGNINNFKTYVERLRSERVKFNASPDEDLRNIDFTFISYEYATQNDNL